MGFWTNKRVCVTGGASLIGSRLVEELINLNVKDVWVADDLTSGNANFLPKDVLVWQDDLRDYQAARASVQHADVVFHLACAHGGRGFVDTHRLECFENLELDTAVFRACQVEDVSKVFFMSSACAYPIGIQQNLDVDLKLTEDLVDYNNIQQPDGAYGFAKLAGELTLNEYARNGAFDSAVVRGFTVYGERMKENHAIGALIAKSFIHQDPFEIWGDGKQKRNWTYVGDTVRGILLATEKLHNDVVNIGVEQYYTPDEAAAVIWNEMGWKPETVKHLTNAPVGTLNRVADCTKAHELLGWTPQVNLRAGLKKTIEWYEQTHDRAEVAASLERSLTER